MAHARGIPVLLDGCQAVVHMPVDVQDARLRLLRLHRPQDSTARPASACSTASANLDAMPPFQGGGEMIETRAPATASPTATRRTRFEAGTPPIVEAIGLGAAIDYISASAATTSPATSTS